jgi:hypothetical protein
VAQVLAGEIMAIKSVDAGMSHLLSILRNCEVFVKEFTIEASLSHFTELRMTLVVMSSTPSPTSSLLADALSGTVDAQEVDRLSRALALVLARTEEFGVTVPNVGPPADLKVEPGLHDVTYYVEET